MLAIVVKVVCSQGGQLVEPVTGVPVTQQGLDIVATVTVE